MADNFSPPRPPERPAGLASRPAPREEKKTGFMESIRSFFSREDDDTDTYVKARDKFYDDPYMAAMEDAAKRATERREQGITQSRKPSAPPAEVYTPEVVEPERATEEVVADVPTGKGLMSVPRPTARPDTFATIIKNGNSQKVFGTEPLTKGFDSLTQSEGTSIHLDGRGFVTLPYGIVPDKNSVKKSDGTAFDPTGSHGLTDSTVSTIDYSNATKYGISRSSYDSDEAFAKAVYAQFANLTAGKYGRNDFADLTHSAKRAAYDMAWNAGIDSAGWSSVKTMLQEASKEGAKDKNKLLEFTTNFRSGYGNYPRGLLKRRLQTYNLVANTGEEASVITTQALKSEGKRTGTRYIVKARDGTVLKVWDKPDTNEELGDLAVTN